MARLLAIALLLLCLPLAAAQRQDDPRPTLILISFDGWRWDYHTKAPAPHLGGLMARGVRAEHLIPVFPTKTFPNHYTIVTGLYPGRHGIVSNSIRDPATGRTFSLANRRELVDPMWWDGEPFWTTVQRAGQTAAAMFWPGSEVSINGSQPRTWRPYDETFPADARVDQVLQWLELPAAERPTFITLYFEDTDTVGHEHGPDSEAMREAITRADGYLGRLLRGLDRLGISDRVNLMVVSDHGMAPVSSDRVVVLDDYVSLEASEVVDLNPTLGIFPRPGTEEGVFRALTNAHPRLKVYRGKETPERWHYRGHLRIPPIVGVVDEGWQILRRSTVTAIREGRSRPAAGQHGYDPAAPTMGGLFVAAGPAFKRGITVPPLANVHLYTLMAQVLGVQPAPNDGDPAVVQALLR